MTVNNEWKLKKLRENNKNYEDNLRTNENDYHKAVENCIGDD